MNYTIGGDLGTFQKTDFPQFLELLLRLVREQRENNVTEHNPWEILLVHGYPLLTQEQWVLCAQVLTLCKAKKPDVYIMVVGKDGNQRYHTFAHIIRRLNARVFYHYV